MTLAASLAAAAGPPEERGLARDEVSLAVVDPVRTVHTTARSLPAHLQPGDLLVVNTSATLPAALDVIRGGVPATLHVSTGLDDGSWVVELRRPEHAGPALPHADEVLRLPGGVRLRIREPHPSGQQRLWRATPLPATDPVDYLPRHGHPIRYAHHLGRWSLEALQNVYAAHPGSAEMPSAGRPISERVLAGLVARGVVVAPIVLHTGVSSQERPEPPQPERFEVPQPTAELVDLARAAGRRVVAVGTTVVRALESAAADHHVRPTRGWTSLVLGPGRPARVVTGLLTGLHAPAASHLDVLAAVAGPGLVARGYGDLVGPGAPQYLWHEFGDSMLLLP